MWRAYVAVVIGALTACNAGEDGPMCDEITWVSDDDGDGWGKEYRGCTRPEMITPAARTGDCHDDDASAFPGSTSLERPFDGIDTDCDGNDFCTDLNCDGRPDVAIPSHHDGDYMIAQPARLLSTDDGHRLEPTDVPMNGTLGVVIADFNEDGYQDIVHASYHDGSSPVTSSFVYWGPDHTVASRQGLPTTGAHWPCVADLDGNGWLDIVFANYNDGDYQTQSFVYWNRGGAFSATDRLPLATVGATHCTIEDLNGDDRPEIVFSSYSDGTTHVLDSYVYWGSASNGFKMRTALPTVGAYALSIADVDANGLPDLVFWSHTNGTTHVTDRNFVYWNRQGAFNANDRLELASMGGFRGAVADLDGDGHNEIIAPGYFDGTSHAGALTYIYWGNADGTWGSARTSLPASGVLDVVVEDINADDHPDLLLASHYDGDSYSPSVVYWGSEEGAYGTTARTELPGYHVTWGTGVADFNRDGYKDVLIPGYHNNVTGTDMAPWENQAFTRIYWGSSVGVRPGLYDQWPTRGAWSVAIAGK